MEFLLFVAAPRTSGANAEKRLGDRSDALGRITAITPSSTDAKAKAKNKKPNIDVSEQEEEDEVLFTVEWIVLGGSSPRIRRSYLVHTTAQAEGMIAVDRRRARRSAGGAATAGPTLFTADKVEARSRKFQEAGQKRKLAAQQKQQQQQKQTTSKEKSKVRRKQPASQSDKESKREGGKESTKGSISKAGKKRKLTETTSSSGAPALTKTTVATPTQPMTGNDNETPAAPDSTMHSPLPGAGAVSSSLATLESNRSMSLYTKHVREFERIVQRLEKVDKFGWFWDDAPSPEYEECYDENIEHPSFPDLAPCNWEMIRRRRQAGRYVLDRERLEEEERFQLLGPYYEWRGKWPKRKFTTSTTKKKPRVNRRVLHKQGVDWTLFQQDVFQMLEATVQRVLREQEEEENNEEANGTDTKKKAPQDKDAQTVSVDVDKSDSECNDKKSKNNTDASDTNAVEDGKEDRSGVVWAAHKIREAVVAVVEKTGRRHERELRSSDDRHKFSLAVDKSWNNEAAMQSAWRRQPFPERQYERLTSDSVCDGLSRVDQGIASHELLTSLDDSFIGVSYRYDDTGQQSEAWMKSVLDETEFLQQGSTAGSDKKKTKAKKRKPKTSDEEDPQTERQAALALAGDDGVTRAQVTATMSTLIMGVEDRVMTEKGVLLQPELRSANWFRNSVMGESDENNKDDEPKCDAISSKHDAIETTTNTTMGLDATATASTRGTEETVNPKDNTDATADEVASASPPQTVSSMVCRPCDPSPKLEPELVEQPVWGIDCYTRRNISICLETEFDAETALTFVEKWVLPAINACPPELAHDLCNATRLLEGLPFVNEEDSSPSGAADDDSSNTQEQQPLKASSFLSKSHPKWSHTLLGNALVKKIQTSAPPWISAAANTLRRAIDALGYDFFRVHPKGHGSVLLSEKVEPNSLITFYRGEIYPLWRWCEKMDAIDITQQRKNLKPALPDFYNMTMERPQSDPRGYGTLIVDASRKAGHGSSLSHSCDPTCEVRVAAYNGELCLAMTTLRELEIGEELTFNYNASTDSLQEYRSAVCLCGYGNCRGSFLHFATADWYQQVLNRNFPIASRVANIVRGSTKQVMSEEDDRILRTHGFKTASFGATAVNRRQLRSTKHGNSSLSDSLDIVPVWLKTYVADVLRYIEYERRALPIALICDKAKEQGTSGEVEGQPSRNEDLIQPENGFSFFVKNQADILVDLVKKSMAGELSEVDVARETRRLGANLWRSLSAEKKQRWQDAARADMEKQRQKLQDEEAGHNNKKQADGKAVNKRSKKESDKSKKSKGKDDNNNKGDITALISSEFEFEDADSEGISAMGQRVQQLTATLSRVGRVLDRHREGLIVITQQIDTNDVEALRGAIHPPLSVMEDDDVINWLWNSSKGVLVPLIRQVKLAKFVRPSLMEGLLDIRKRFSVRLSPQRTSSGDDGNEERYDGPSSVRRQILNEGLLEIRSLILVELRAMAKDFRHRNKPISTAPANANTAKSDDGNEQAQSGDAVGEGSSSVPVTDNIRIEEVIAQEKEAEPDVNGRKDENMNENEEESQTETKPGAENSEVSASESGTAACDGDPSPGESSEDDAEKTCDTGMLNESSAHNTAELDKEKDLPVDESAPTSGTSEEGQRADNVLKDTQRDSKEGKSVKFTTDIEKEDEPWIAHYSDRFMLQASADVVLMYAHTQNFFSICPYASLESSPIEIYARELGNNVPRSVIDSEVTYADDSDPKSSKQRKAAALTSPVSEKETIKPKKISRRKSEEKCNPEDVVAEVKVSYQGDYVLSQLLQWYNGGMGQKPGLPNLSGAVVLPLVEACWSSKLAAKRRSRVLTKTHYESKIRPKLCEWMQDPYRRGDPWPCEVDEAFVLNDESGHGTASDGEGVVRFGTPVLDFLVTGDESGIFNVLEELDADNKLSSSCEDPTLLTSVDKGRPAQAVCRWVQCENPDCLKWRKIPWHVDIDLLPEHFFCKDNKWNPSKRSCDAPEDDWDNEDKIVGSDGKVEGSPLRKEKFKSPSNEKSFFVGARFDVLRVVNREEKFVVATVTHVDFSGSVKRVKFHFKNTSSDTDEWISFGSRRIAPLHSKTQPPASKRKLLDGGKGPKKDSTKKASDKGMSTSETSGESKSTTNRENETNGKTPSEKEPKQKRPAEKEFKPKPPRKKIKLVSASDEESFQPKARFDVLRKVKGKEKWVCGKVVAVDLTAEGERRIRFHFRKSKDEDDEWIVFGSPRIATLHTHTTPNQPKRRSTDDNAMGVAKANKQDLSGAVAGSIHEPRDLASANIAVGGEMASGVQEVTQTQSLIRHGPGLSIADQDQTSSSVSLPQGPSDGNPSRRVQTPSEDVVVSAPVTSRLTAGALSVSVAQGDRKDKQDHYRNTSGPKGGHSSESAGNGNVSVATIYPQKKSVEEGNLNCLLLAAANADYASESTSLTQRVIYPERGMGPAIPVPQADAGPSRRDFMVGTGGHVAKGELHGTGEQGQYNIYGQTNLNPLRQHPVPGSFSMGRHDTPHPVQQTMIVPSNVPPHHNISSAPLDSLALQRLSEHELAYFQQLAQHQGKQETRQHSFTTTAPSWGVHSDPSLGLVQHPLQQQHPSLSHRTNLTGPALDSRVGTEGSISNEQLLRTMANMNNNNGSGVARLVSLSSSSSNPSQHYPQQF